MKCIRPALFIAYIALAVSAPSSQEAKSAFSALSSCDGLSNSSISAIVQDTMGFLWFGTQGGLNRYDGYSFKLYENEPFNPNSLSHNQVQCLYMDSGDLLWVGTYGGLNRFDIITETFSPYRFDPEDPASLSNDVVTAICRDARGELWVGTLNGLNRLDEREGSFERFFHDPAKPASLPANVIRCIYSDDEGRLWVGSSGGGLARYDRATGTFVRYVHDAKDSASLPDDNVMAIGQAPDGSLWVGTWFGGVSRMDPETGTFRSYPLPSDRIYCMNLQEPGIVRAGTWGGGLYELDIASGSITGYRAGPEAGSISHDVVYSMLIDRSGELWVGTNGGGVNKLTRVRRSYTVYQADVRRPGSLAPGKVNALIMDSRGTFWAGVYNGGLNRYDPVSGTWKAFKREPSRLATSLPHDIVTSIYEDSKGRFWVTSNGGLSLMDREAGTFRTWHGAPHATASGDLGADILFCMLEAREGGFWVGTFTAGLERWDPEKGVIERFPFDPENPSSISDNLVNALVYDAEGRLWVGTNKGLNRYEGGGRFTRYLYDASDPRGVSGDSIKSFYIDSESVLWICSMGGGLMRYDEASDGFIHFTKREGLPSNDVLRVLEDDSRDLWIATQAGLVRFERATGQFRVLSVYSDLRDRELTAGAFRGPGGELYFSSLGAIYRFDPGRYEYNAHVPPVFVTSLLVLNKPMRLPRIVAVTDSIELSFQENYIELGFAALDYRDPERNQYAYMLEGFDKEWIYCGSRRYASYTNLPGGQYIFRVKAANNDGIWNEEGASLTIGVSSHPLLTLPAFLAYGALVVLLVWAVATRRGKGQLRLKIAELTATRNALEEANVKLERLSLIDGLTGIANRRKLDEQLSRDFAAAAREGKRLAALMVDIDFFKAYNDHFGHQAGDECLKRVAACLVSSMERATDTVSRYGGEEFLILLPGTDEGGAMIVADKARRSVERLLIPHAESRISSVVTISVGYASVLPKPDDDPQELVKQADIALYRAKELGRNRVSGA